jgi:hypothetical protein
MMEKTTPGLPSPKDLFEEAVRYLEPSDCLQLIPQALIADYVLAKYYLINAQYELSKTATVGYKNKDSPELVVTPFTKAMLEMQKNVIATWQPIWDIVSRNSERLIANPEDDLMAFIATARQRRKPQKEGGNGNS